MKEETSVEVDGLCRVDVTRNDDGSASVTASGPTKYESRSNYMVFLGVKADGRSLVSVEIAANEVDGQWYVDFLLNADRLGASEVMVCYDRGTADPDGAEICSRTVIN